MQEKELYFKCPHCDFIITRTQLKEESFSEVHYEKWIEGTGETTRGVYRTPQCEKLSELLHRRCQGCKKESEYIPTIDESLINSYLVTKETNNRTDTNG